MHFLVVVGISGNCVCTVTGAARSAAGELPVENQSARDTVMCPSDSMNFVSVKTMEGDVVRM